MNPNTIMPEVSFFICFGIYNDFSYFLPDFFRLLGWVWELFWEFLQFQLLFLGFFPAFGLSLGCCFGDFCSFSYFFLAFFWLLDWVWVVSSPPRRYEVWTASFSILACASSVICSCFSSHIIRSNRYFFKIFYTIIHKEHLSFVCILVVSLKYFITKLGVL